MTRALVVIPTYNESATLQKAVMRALAADGRVSVLIVDDGSPDGTGALADDLARSIPRVNVLHREGKLGLGSAYRGGFTWGLERGFDVVGEMDADLSHPAESLPALLDALDRADVAIGSRYVPGGETVGWPLKRHVLSRGANTYVRLWTGVPVKDATAGFRAYRAAVIERLDMRSLVTDGYGFQLEMTLRAWREGFRIAEVPIRFVERQEGASKMSGGIISEALWMVAGWGWRIRTGQAPLPTPVEIPLAAELLGAQR